MDPLRHVKFFAAVKHTGQTYGSGLPYTHHLAAVEQVLRRFNVTDETLLTASWLHDVIEDTETKRKEVEEMFGSEVAHLVYAVTNEEGANRKIRHALTYPKIREAGPLAVRLKLADRIANVEAGGNLFGMYKKEHEDFKRALFTAGQNEDMWTHLEGLMSTKSKQ
jgi:guanosine-3',5'-bis(diphosphate) 3'-pyrophosphohydrolase